MTINLMLSASHYLCMGSYMTGQILRAAARAHHGRGVRLQLRGRGAGRPQVVQEHRARRGGGDHQGVMPGDGQALDHCPGQRCGAPVLDGDLHMRPPSSGSAFHLQHLMRFCCLRPSEHDAVNAKTVLSDI